MKKILNRDIDRTGETRWLGCCWEDCEKDSYELFKTRFHDHNPGMRCDDILSKHIWYTFCSERHKQYFLHSHIDKGNLPPGYRNVI